MYNYKLYTIGPEKSPANGIMRLPDYALIPASDENRDWVEYQKWLSEGNEPLPVDEPPSEKTNK
jgi:hypothetical protein